MPADGCVRGGLVEPVQEIISVQVHAPRDGWPDTASHSSARETKFSVCLGRMFRRVKENLSFGAL